MLRLSSFCAGLRSAQVKRSSEGRVFLGVLLLAGPLSLQAADESLVTPEKPDVQIAASVPEPAPVSSSVSVSGAEVESSPGATLATIEPALVPAGMPSGVEVIPLAAEIPQKAEKAEKAEETKKTVAPSKPPSRVTGQQSGNSNVQKMIVERLVASDRPADRVLESIETMAGVKFEMPDRFRSELAGSRLSVDFSHAPLADIVHAVSRMLKVDADIKGRRVLLVPRAAEDAISPVKIQGAGSEPLPEVIEIRHIQTGDSLRDVLARWGSKENWTLVWDADLQDAILRANMSFEGNMTESISRLADALPGNLPIRIGIYPPNRVIHVYNRGA